MKTSSTIFKKIWITPSPTSMQEVHYLYNNLRRIAPIESFSLKKHDVGYRNELRLTFNLLSQNSLDPFKFRHGVEPNENEHDSGYLDSLRARTEEYLHRIIAIPRFQFIHNDTQYLEGHSQIAMNYKLVNEGLKYSQRFEINDCNIDSPFCLINMTNVSGDSTSLRRDIRVIKRDIRFNFERFMKVNVIN